MSAAEYASGGILTRRTLPAALLLIASYMRRDPLVHATKHVKGASLMKQAMVASGSRSELGYAGETRHRMSPLFNLDADNLPVHLLRRFAGQTLTFSDVVARTIEETGTCVEVDYRRCLKQLDRDGVIKVQRVSTVRGLDKDDRIMFPLAVGL